MDTELVLGQSTSRCRLREALLDALSPLATWPRTVSVYPMHTMNAGSIPARKPRFQKDQCARHTRSQLSLDRCSWWPHLLQPRPSPRCCPPASHPEQHHVETSPPQNHLTRFILSILVSPSHMGFTCLQCLSVPVPSAPSCLFVGASTEAHQPLYLLSSSVYPSY